MAVVGSSLEVELGLGQRGWRELVQGRRFGPACVKVSASEILPTTPTRSVPLGTLQRSMACHTNNRPLVGVATHGSSFPAMCPHTKHRVSPSLRPDRHSTAPPLLFPLLP